jgi:hypothetical protein
MARVKWSADKRKWVFDWSGVTIEEARARGFRGLPRTVGDPNRSPPLSPRPLWRRPVVKLLIAATAAMAAAKAERRAAARVRRSAYFAAWWVSVGKDRRRLRREAARALSVGCP